MSALISPHFTWAEVTRSPTAAAKGIDNSLPEELEGNARRTAEAMERVRAVVGGPLQVNSWYRCPELNTAIGGSKTSVHPKALAVDFHPLAMPLAEAFRRIAESDIEFDQLIIERTNSGAHWIHFGLSDGLGRRQVLSAAGDTLGGPMHFERVLVG